MQTDKQADEHIDIHRQTDVQANRDRHRCRQDIDIESDRKKDRHTYKLYKQTRQISIRQTNRQKNM